MDILKLLYPDDEIFISGYEFDDKELSIRVKCVVPNKSYAKRYVPYVTAENYVRCLSQASYLLSYHVLSNKLIPADIDENSFLKAMENYELYYRNLSMTFHKQSKRNEEFIMDLSLKNFRGIKTLKDYILFTFVNKKIVIGGEMSFVFLK